MDTEEDCVQAETSSFLDEDEIRRRAEIRRADLGASSNETIRPHSPNNTSTPRHTEVIRLELVVGEDGELSAVIQEEEEPEMLRACLLYTSPSPRDRQKSRMPSSA